MTSLEPTTAKRVRGRDEPREAADRRPRDRNVQTEERAAGPRWSPDPFVATDRYRLTMPYDDRI